MTSNIHEASAGLRESAAWLWLAYDSGLSLRRAKTIAEDHRRSNAFSLYELLLENPDVWAAALRLTGAESDALQSNHDRMAGMGQKLMAWQAAGIHTLRWDDAAYPVTLNAHLRPEQRPLFLSQWGDLDLLDLPTVLPLTGDLPDDEAKDWTAETLLSLSSEGVLPLLVARPGLDAAMARQLLDAEAPLALVIAQGLAAYQPPPALAGAVEAGRCLLLSPFRPDQPLTEPNALLPHAALFAQALANALLVITPPHPQDILPEQPCFLRPGLPKTLGCQSYYADPEDFFLRLVETPAAAAAANQSPPSLVEAGAPDPLPAAPQPPDPEALIRRLSELGNVPEAMKARLRQSAAS